MGGKGWMVRKWKRLVLVDGPTVADEITRTLRGLWADDSVDAWVCLEDSESKVRTHPRARKCRRVAARIERADLGLVRRRPGDLGRGESTLTRHCSGTRAAAICDALLQTQ